MARRTSSRRGAIGRPASRVMPIRQLHTYLSVFVAPTVLFFALTGILQLYGLHETHPGYRPPPLVEKLGRVHKDQSFSLGPERPEPPPPLSTRVGPPPSGGGEGDWVKPMAKSRQEDGRSAPPKALNLETQALKALFCAAAVMLIVSALLGVWMAVTQNRRKILLLVVFLLGAAAPVAILLL